MQQTGFLIDAPDAAPLVETQQCLIIDLSSAENHQRRHLPGAIHLDYQYLVHGMLPAPGGIPSVERLQALFNALGLMPDTQVLAYDDEGNGKASRFIWTLDIIGHSHYKLLNGGIYGWLSAGFPTSQQIHQPRASQASLAMSNKPVADKEYVLSVLQSEEHVLLDTRSEAEYTGQRAGGLRGGHIPGAVHFDWLDAIDRQNDLKLFPDEALQARFDELGVSKDKEIITYCQTHHRASHTYVALKHLGYSRIRGYAGSWAEWGNDPSLPIE